MFLKNGRIFIVCAPPHPFTDATHAHAPVHRSGEIRATLWLCTKSGRSDIKTHFRLRHSMMERWRFALLLIERDTSRMQNNSTCRVTKYTNMFIVLIDNDMNMNSLQEGETSRICRLSIVHVQFFCEHKHEHTYGVRMYADAETWTTKYTWCSCFMFMFKIVNMNMGLCRREKHRGCRDFGCKSWCFQIMNMIMSILQDDVCIRQVSTPSVNVVPHAHECVCTPGDGCVTPTTLVASKKKNWISIQFRALL